MNIIHCQPIHQNTSRLKESATTLKLLGIQLSDESYACIWDDVQKRNAALGLSPMSESEKYLERRKLNLL